MHSYLQTKVIKYIFVAKKLAKHRKHSCSCKHTKSKWFTMQHVLSIVNSENVLKISFHILYHTLTFFSWFALKKFFAFSFKSSVWVVLKWFHVGQVFDHLYSQGNHIFILLISIILPISFKDKNVCVVIEIVTNRCFSQIHVKFFNGVTCEIMCFSINVFRLQFFNHQQLHLVSDCVFWKHCFTMISFFR